MAELTLGTHEVYARPLPSVCACCGQPVAVWKQKTFSWYPKWVLITLVAGLLIFAIVAMVMTKKARMAIPLCAQHSNHFLTRALVLWLGFAGIFGVVFLCSLVPGADMIWLAVPIYFLAWLVVAAVLGSTAIRPAEITDHYVRLKNVSEAFVGAHQALGPMPMAQPYGMPYMAPPA